MNQHIVLALGHRFSSLEIERAVLAKIATVVDGNVLTSVQLTEALGKVNAVLLGTRAQLDAANIDAMSQCRVIARYGVGLDNVDIEQATRRGILVVNVPDYCVDEVSDHAVTLLLAASRHLIAAQAWLRSGKWGTSVMQGATRLSEQTAGIIGFGRIGLAAARKVRPFVRRVLAFDPIVPAEIIEREECDPVDLSELFRLSDYVSLHCPLTSETRHLINRETLACMKPNAWLVNTSRGELIDQVALTEVLLTHRIGGAALDVFATEPPPQDSPLFTVENVILTPHVAWYSESAIADLQRLAAEQVLDSLTGKHPKQVCNPSVLEGKSSERDKTT